MSLLKGGWHPSGDKAIHRATWKQDLKNIAGRKDDAAEHASNHTAAPLASLKDPDSFGPPPKHTAYYPNAQTNTTRPLPSSSSTTAPVRSGGNVDTEQEQGEQPPRQAYSVNTTGLRTDNLPLPPGRREVPQTPTTASRPVPSLPQIPTATRPVPSLPPRTTSGPAPMLPPRQTETPSEYDPPPPPTYGEALAAPSAALNRLGQAGISVPGFDIGSQIAQSRDGRSGTGSQAGQAAQAVQGHSGQLSELQQRFARMNGGGSTATQATSSGSSEIPLWKQATGSTSPAVPAWKQAQAAHNSGISPSSLEGVQAVAAMASQKKKPPPPPTKKAALGETGAPPPIPMSSKPRPD